MFRFICLNCKVVFFKSGAKKSYAKRTFCNKECYWDYARKNPQEFKECHFQLGHKHTEEIIKKISTSKRGISVGVGRKLSEEHINNLSIGHLGQKTWNTGLKMKPGYITESSNVKRRESHIKYREKHGITKPMRGKHETQILDELELLFQLPIERNFRTIGYFPDGYVRELNLIIEIDEGRHFNRDGTYKEKDLRRQKNIEMELGCTFLRIKDIYNRRRIE